MSRHAKERGQVLPLVAISLAGLMGFAGISVDVGYAEYQQRQQQSATDAAAVGGAQTLVYNGCGNSTAATTAAQSDASRNGYTNGNGKVVVTTTLGSSLTSGPFKGNTCAVQVQVTAPHPTFFGALFGFNKPGTETTQAVAVLAAVNPAPDFDGPNPAGPPSNFTGPITATGPIQVGTFTSTNTTITAPSIGYSGQPPSTKNTSFPQGSPAPMVPPVNPCPEIAGCASLSNNPPSTSNCPSLKIQSDQTVNPGCYSGITVTSGCMANVTLSPGLYAFTGTADFTNAQSVTGSGVTFYQANGALNLSNIATTLSPPTSGTYSNILYYQVPGDTTGPNFDLANTSSRLGGLIYAPGATLTYSGSAGSYVLLVANAFNITGRSTFASPDAGQSILQQAVLAQ
jgi:hypothetical protein